MIQKGRQPLSEAAALAYSTTFTPFDFDSTNGVMVDAYIDATATESGRLPAIVTKINTPPSER